MNICVRFVEMILQSSLTLCPTPAAAGFGTEQWAPMMLFDMTLHICQARKIGVTAVDFARNTRYGVELVGHGVVEGRRKDGCCDTQEPNVEENGCTYSLSS
jgi:hypothetical protein